jgi:hypothetical protein
VNDVMQTGLKNTVQTIDKKHIPFTTRSNNARLYLIGTFKKEKYSQSLKHTYLHVYQFWGTTIKNKKQKDVETCETAAMLKTPNQTIVNILKNRCSMKELFPLYQLHSTIHNQAI